MTVVAVLADPPRSGLVLSHLAETTPLSEDECAELYAAMIRDVAQAAATSGGDLLINYRPDESLPEQFQEGDGTAEAELREVVASVESDARLERQVGETFSGRAGNTASHLLDSDGVQSVAITTPESAFLARQQVDEAAMKLRSSEVVLGPATESRVYYAAFSADIDFQDAYTTPAIETLTDRGLDMGHAVDYLPQLPVIETATDLAHAVVAIRTRERAGRTVPQHTADALSEFGLVVETDDELSLHR